LDGPWTALCVCEVYESSSAHTAGSTATAAGVSRGEREITPTADRQPRQSRVCVRCESAHVHEDQETVFTNPYHLSSVFVTKLVIVGRPSCLPSCLLGWCWRVQLWRARGGQPSASPSLACRRPRVDHSELPSNESKRGVNPTHTEPQPDTAGGKYHRGETAQGGTHHTGKPIRQHPPHRESSRRGSRCNDLAEVVERSSDFRVKQTAPPTASSCSHRAAEILYYSVIYIYIYIYIIYIYIYIYIYI